ncbi:uncharacterized protein LOC118458818 [Anopheles albimanus]|uniref:uncharacterized protein LOC118458818 n=1 Tax=Anopheles albimanus TaxID=7167 RepID=UPI00163E9F55|nr:uncharacterized protein LOC118458818 [Anopheles albimanus]
MSTRHNLEVGERAQRLDTALIAKRYRSAILRGEESRECERERVSGRTSVFAPNRAPNACQLVVDSRTARWKSKGAANAADKKNVDTTQKQGWPSGKKHSRHEKSRAERRNEKGNRIRRKKRP